MAEEIANVVIADPDYKYIKSYEKELLLRFQSIAAFQIITKSEYKENYFRVHRDIDILVIDRSFYGDFVKEHNIAHTIVLENEIAVESIDDADESIQTRMKIAPVEELVDLIGEYLTGERVDKTYVIPASGENSKQTKVISVFSSVGGCGKSLVSIALGRKLKKLGEQALVIGCDDMQSFEIYLESRQNADESLAVMLKNGEDDLYWTILRNISNEQVPCLLPFSKPLSALGIGAAELLRLIETLKEKKDFGYIILDLGSDMGEINRAMTRISDVCVLITEPTVASCRKLEKMAINQDLMPVKATMTIANQYHSDGIHLNGENLFGSFSSYDTIPEAMEDPLFYRMALEITT